MKNYRLFFIFSIITLIYYFNLVVAQEDKPIIEQEVVDRLQTEPWVRVSITLEEGVSSAEILNELGNNFILESKDEFYDRRISGKINNAGFNLIKDDGRVLGISMPNEYNAGPAIEIKKENNTWTPKILFFAFLLFVFYILWRKFYKKR